MSWNLARLFSREQPLMPMTPQQRVQMAVNGELIPLIAELVYQSDKKSRSAKLDDLRSEGARAVYLAEAMMILAPEARHDRMMRVHEADAATFAHAEKEQADVDWQARQDVIRYGDRARFGVVSPGHCYVCRQPVITDRAVVIISDNLQGEGHGLCLAKAEDRFELVADFAYRVKGGSR